MKRTIFFFSMLISVNAFSQEREEPSYTRIYRQDTIELAPFHASSMVSYKFESVTLLVDLADFKVDFDALWRRCQIVRKDRRRSAQNRTGFVKCGDKTWHFIDSIYQETNNSNGRRDPMYLSQKLFRAVKMDDLINFFPRMIEKNRCTILDTNGNIHRKIVRQAGAIIGGGGSFGGKRYYLIGARTFFVEAVDWEE